MRSLHSGKNGGYGACPLAARLYCAETNALHREIERARPLRSAGTRTQRRIIRYGAGRTSAGRICDHELGELERYSIAVGDDQLQLGRFSSGYFGRTGYRNINI